jgi:hypothetical protein
MDMARFGNSHDVGYQRVLSSILDVLTDIKDKTRSDGPSERGGKVDADATNTFASHNVLPRTESLRTSLVPIPI